MESLDFGAMHLLQLYFAVFFCRTLLPHLSTMTCGSFSIVMCADHVILIL